MNIPRFIIQPDFIDEAARQISCQDAKLVKQVRKVLRLENGDKIDILDGLGNIYHCILQNFGTPEGRQILHAKIESKQSIVSFSLTKVTVALPLIKPARFEWAIEKLTELGVNTIIPILLDRSIIKFSSKSQQSKDISDSLNFNNKLSRWTKIIEEASEQSERALPPLLSNPLTFSNWLAQNSTQTGSQLRLICTERKNVEPLETLLYNQNSCPSSCAIALGAEGGFTEEEIKLALSHRFIPVSLGPQILRTETAAIYTLAIVNAFLKLIQQDPQR